MNIDEKQVAAFVASVQVTLGKLNIVLDKVAEFLDWLMHKTPPQPPQV